MGSDQPTGTVERQRYSARLAKAWPLLVTTGGLHYGTPPSEAQLMADSLRDDFVRALERRAQPHDVGKRANDGRSPCRPRASSAWWWSRKRGMPRAVWSFEKAGFEVVAAPVGFGPRQRPASGGWMPEFKSIWQSGQLLN